MKTKTILLLLLLASMLCCCNGKQTPNQNTLAGSVVKPPANPKTVTELNEQLDNVSLYKAPDGKLIKITLMADDYKEEGEMDLVKSKTKTSCDNASFEGKDRKACKTSIVTATTEKFLSLTALIATLKNDSLMMKNTKIKKDPNNPRVKEEKRNVKLSNVYIYALKHESDNDYHIIIGDDKALYFNVENSGLPDAKAKDYKKLLNVRKQVEAYFGKVCNSNYLKFDPAIPIEIEGSLFYDIDHKPGVVGPAGYKPLTSWEIHPITNIVFK